MLGKYSTKVVLPKTKFELVRQINALEKVEIKVIEPVDNKTVGCLKLHIDRIVGDGKKVSVIIISKL